MKFPFFSGKKENRDLYLGIFLKEEEGYVMAISFSNGSTEIIEKERFAYTNGWENLTDDVDEVLYRLEKKLNKQLEKTIFFVYSHLVDEKIGDIKKPYLQKIKELVKNLELQALGYIECFEAVSSYLARRDEVPLTGILVELDKTSISLFIYKGGKVVHRKNIVRSANIIDDLLSGFSELRGKPMLPAKIILYDSTNLDAATERILSYRWEEDYFIQLPKVQVVGEDEVLKSLVDVFAEQILSKTPAQDIVEKALPKETFGFVINEDIAEDKNPAPPVVVNVPGEKPKKMDYLGFLKNIKLPKLNFDLSGKIFLVLGIVVIIGALFLNEYFLHKATLKLFLPSKTLKENANYSVDYAVASSSANFSSSMSTTGQKDIGSPAKGEVTIRSFDDSSKTFTAGTVLTTNNIKFTLDSDVKVASSSLAADGSAKLPGTSKVAVTASSIGPQGNLDKGQHFSIADLSTNTYFAINDAPITGGSKKTIQTVASADVDKLQNNIIEKAKSQQKINNSSLEFIPELTQINLLNTKLSSEVGAQATQVTLTATAATSYYSFQKNDLLTKINENLSRSIPEGYGLDNSRITFTIKKTTKSANSLNLDLAVDAKAVKTVSQNDVLVDSTGKSKDELKDILKNKFSIGGYDLNIKEPLPVLNNYLPFFKNNINLSVSSL